MKVKSFITIVWALGWLIALSLSCDQSVECPEFKWKKIGSIPGVSGKDALGLAGPVAGIVNGKLLVGGGSNFRDAAPWDNGQKTYYDEVFIYNPKKDTLQLEHVSKRLPYKVAYSANIDYQDQVIMAGGEDDSGARSDVLLLKWNKEEKDLSIDFLPSLPKPLTSGSLAVIDTDLFYAGGQNSEEVSNSLYHLDMNDLKKGWRRVSQLPYPVTHAVLLGFGEGDKKSLFLVGGRKRNPGDTSTLYKNVLKFEIGEQKWTEKADLPHSLAAHSGVRWKDQGILIFSGDKGETFHQTEELIAKIDRETDSVRRADLIIQKNKLQEDHPGFDPQVLYYDLRSDQWTKLEDIPFPGQVTTTAINWKNQIILPGGEIRAGIRTPDIVGGVP